MIRRVQPSFIVRMNLSMTAIPLFESSRDELLAVIGEPPHRPAFTLASKHLLVKNAVAPWASVVSGSAIEPASCVLTSDDALPTTRMGAERPDPGDRRTLTESPVRRGVES